MPSRRLFIALPLPEPIRAEIETLLSPRLPDVGWTRPEQLHLTLRFLGDVDSARIEELETALARVRVEPFVLPVEGVGAFPPDRPPRVLWVGVGRGHPRLHQLRQRIDDTILQAGHPLDVKTFSPHITLGRCDPPGGGHVRRWLEQHREFAAAPFRVSSFELLSSELRPAGPVHTSLRHFSLMDEPSTASPAP